MPPIYIPTYSYDDPALAAPAPGRALIEEIGLVESILGVGPKGGGRYMGTVVAIGPLNTRLHRPYDGIEMTLPNVDVRPWTAPFESAAFRGGHYGPYVLRRVIYEVSSSRLRSPRDAGYGWHFVAVVDGRRGLAVRHPETTRPLIERCDNDR